MALGLPPSVSQIGKLRASPTSRQICGGSLRGSRCHVTACRSCANPAQAKRLAFAQCHLWLPSSALVAPLAVDNFGIDREFTRTIRRNYYRAIRRTTIVLSGVRDTKNFLATKRCARRNSSNKEFFEFLLTDARVQRMHGTWNAGRHIMIIAILNQKRWSRRYLVRPADHLRAGDYVPARFPSHIAAFDAAPRLFAERGTDFEADRSCWRSTRLHLP